MLILLISLIITHIMPILQKKDGRSLVILNWKSLKASNNQPWSILNIFVYQNSKSLQTIPSFFEIADEYIFLFMSFTQFYLQCQTHRLGFFQYYFISLYHHDTLLTLLNESSNSEPPTWINMTYLMFGVHLPVSPNLFLKSAQCIAQLHFSSVSRDTKLVSSELWCRTRSWIAWGSGRPIRLSVVSDSNASGVWVCLSSLSRSLRDFSRLKTSTAPSTLKTRKQQLVQRYRYNYSSGNL